MLTEEDLLWLLFTVPVLFYIAVVVYCCFFTMHFRYLYSKISTDRKDQPSSIKSVRAPPAKTISMITDNNDDDNHNYYGDAFNDDTHIFTDGSPKDPAVPTCYGVEMDITKLSDFS